MNNRSQKSSLSPFLFLPDRKGLPTTFLIPILCVALILSTITLMPMPALSSQCGHFFHFVRQLYPRLAWRPAQRGELLHTFSAILTCESASAFVRSAEPFSSQIQWTAKEGSYYGVIPSTRALVVRSESFDAQPDIIVEIVKTEGEVFVSTDRELIEKSNFTYMMEGDYEKELEEDKKRLSDLKVIGWESLKLDSSLGPWDMIWTDEDSRVEIEITADGIDSLVDEATNVIGPDGRFTKRKRFPPNSTFVMKPQFYSKAKVNKIIGKVWVATNREKVKEFVRKHRTGLGAMDRTAHLKWRELLKKKELE